MLRPLRRVFKERFESVFQTYQKTAGFCGVSPLLGSLRPRSRSLGLCNSFGAVPGRVVCAAMMAPPPPSSSSSYPGCSFVAFPFARTLFTPSVISHSPPSSQSHSRSRSDNVSAALCLRCPDKPGIVSALSACISHNGGNLTSLDTFVDHPPAYAFPHLENENGGPSFVARAVFEYDPAQWKEQQVKEAFGAISKEFQASVFKLQFGTQEHVPRIAVLAGPTAHCLIDLLQRYQAGTLPVRITAVISNHSLDKLDHNNGYVKGALESLKIPFHQFATSSKPTPTPTPAAEDGLCVHRREPDILKVLNALDAPTDFLVLARYMQVLSPSFLDAYGRDVVNIHHGLLPSFKGGHPYRQAYAAGVRIIGATAHFVTAQLDEGPIIAQNAVAVTHRESLDGIKDISEGLERETLSYAVSLVANARVVRISLNRLAVMN